MDVVKNKDIELNTGEIIKDDIQYYIELFCNEYDIDIKSIRPQEWTAILKFICDKYIKPNKLLLIQQNIIPYKRYNYFAINQLIDKYTTLCNIYNQSMSIIAFSILSGISQESIYQWRNDKQKHIIYINSDGSIKDYNQMLSISSDGYDEMLTITPMEIYQKLITNIEQNLNDMVIDNKRKGIGTIVRYNKFYETHPHRAGDQQQQLVDSSELAKKLGIDTKLLEIQEKN